MGGKMQSYKRKKHSKVTMKTHRKKKPRIKTDWQKIFRERFYT